jgi:dihydrofolate reductase
MRVSLVAAASANNVIGADGALPWHLPDDFRYFRKITMGAPVVMGRRTWESIGKPLPGRTNIVMTRRRGFAAAGAVVVHSQNAALEAAGDAAELFVIGGGEIYIQFLPIADRIYLTQVDAVVAGDARFPPLDDGDWALVSRDPHPADARHAHAFEFRVYDRRGSR